MSCERQVDFHLLNDWLQFQNTYFSCCGFGSLIWSVWWLIISQNIMREQWANDHFIPVVLIFKPCDKYLSVYIKEWMQWLPRLCPFQLAYYEENICIQSNGKTSGCMKGFMGKCTNLMGWPIAQLNLICIWIRTVKPNNFEQQIWSCGRLQGAGLLWDSTRQYHQGAILLTLLKNSNNNNNIYI